MSEKSWGEGFVPLSHGTTAYAQLQGLQKSSLLLVDDSGEHFFSAVYLWAIFHSNDVAYIAFT